jgi:RND superfamily putative drug exporter
MFLPAGTGEVMGRLSRLVIRRRWWILGLALVFLPVAGGLGSSVKEHLSSGGLVDAGSDSARADRLLGDQFDSGAPNLLLLVTAASGAVDDDDVSRAGLDLTQTLQFEPGVTGVVSYWSLGRAAPLRSKDGRQALILGRIPGDEDRVEEVVERIARRYPRSQGVVSVGVGGAGEVFRQLSDRAERDLRRSEVITAPVTGLLLLVVFGSVAAAGLPLAVGALAVVGTLLVLRLITALTDVSIFALNLTTALGLGLAVDYSLLIVSRYREELGRGHEPSTAIEHTLHTAGRMVAFSALTVAVSLGTLLVFPLPLLRSFAYAGVGVVAMAATGAVVVLPALLAVLGRGIDAGTLTRREAKAPEDGFWYRRAQAVMRHPVPVALAVVAVLVTLAVPFLHLRTGLSDDRVLAPGAPVRQVHDAIRAGFSAKETSALSVVAPSAPGSPARAGLVDRYAAALSALPGVARVDALTGYYAGSRQARPPDARSRRFDDPAGTWLSVVPSVEPLSTQGEVLVEAVRRAPAPFPVVVGGDSAELVDSKHALSVRLPLALLVVALVTFLLLFLMVGGLLVPFKALLLNLLSLSATFGALVWIFQDGHLSGLLGFTPTGTISVVMPLLLFCVVFGLSMDYEVFLLSRIKEEYDLGRDNDEAVAIGLERTGRIVTAAAVLLAVIFFAFATSQVVVVKIFGIGAALAVLVDAFLIRVTLVPAFMRLAGRANWWAPPVMRRLVLASESGPPDLPGRVSSRGGAERVGGAPSA